MLFRSDELRAKVDLARERMDQLRSSLSDSVNQASASVQDALNNVAQQAEAAAPASAATPAPAEKPVDAKVEPVEG